MSGPISTVTDTVKISELTALTAPTASDQIPIVSGGQTKNVTPGLLATDWHSLPVLPTASYNGNRSYTLTFAATDYSGVISPGMRLRATRTVAAPTQSTLLNGTTQFYSRASASVAGMTFTNNFVVSAWVKLSSYAQGVIASRYNGTSGWRFNVESTGQVTLAGFNASSANFSFVQSYQSIPLNKWVHVSAQLDMATFTATTTTSYVMIDGVDVPSVVSRAGTNPTALVQAGNLEIGSNNGGLLPFAGKIAQVAIYNAKVTQATIRTSISQTLAGTETSLISAYSFNNSITDLNTTNANNLTANGSAVATNADSPFGGQASGSISSTLEYAIVQSATFSTNTTLTVQVPEGGAIPTTGGIAAVSYATVSKPYGMPTQKGKWIVETVHRLSSGASSGTTTGTWYNAGLLQINVPIGEWNVIDNTTYQQGTPSTTGVASILHALYTSVATPSGARTIKVVQSVGQFCDFSFSFTDPYSFTTATILYANIMSNQSITGFAINPDGAVSSITAENAYL